MKNRPEIQAEREIEALFRLSLDGFTTARNALASSLKKDGLAELAARVKALPKPPLSAWAVNQLHWQRPAVLDALITTGDAFRRVQTARFSGEGPDLRQAFDQRRDALSAAATAVADILKKSGHPATPDLLRRVTTTLEALATLGTTAFAPPRGRLIADLAPQGFEVLSALIPRGSDGREGGPSEVVPFGRPTGRVGRQGQAAEQPSPAVVKAAAKKALREAERHLAKARSAAALAERALKTAAARHKTALRARAAVEREKAVVDRRHAAAVGKADVAGAAAHTRAREAEEAASLLQHAERGLERARQQLDNLG